MAILLAVIGVIGLVALYMVEGRASGFSKHESEASVLAEDKMEVLRTIIPPCQGIVPCVALVGTDLALDEQEVVGAGQYRRDWSITPNVAPSPAWWDYVVTVSWTEDGVPRTVTESSRY